VSVAQRTELIIRHSVRVRVWKIMSLMKIINPVRQTNPMIVPMMPRNTTIPKFSKNKDFLRLYPAEKIIGGRMIAKKISLLNYIACPRALDKLVITYLAKAAVNMPMNMAIVDSCRYGTFLYSMTCEVITYKTRIMTKMKASTENVYCISLPSDCYCYDLNFNYKEPAHKSLTKKA